MISSTLNVAKSSNSIPVYAIPFQSVGNVMFVDEPAAISLVVPEGMNVAIVEYNAGSKVLVNEGPIAAVKPVLGGIDPSTARMNPTGIWVTPGTTLHFQTFNTTGDVLTVSFFNNEEQS